VVRHSGLPCELFLILITLKFKQEEHEENRLKWRESPVFR